MNTSMASDLRIEDNPAGRVDATIPWVAAGDDSWQKTPATFSESDAGSGVTANGWLATTDTELLLRLEVHGKTHINSQSGDNIWNGDFVRIGVDGKGDGSAGGAADLSGTFGEDDASIGFALTPTGAQGWVYSTGDSENSGTYPAELLKFVRDDATQITRYDIRLPWNRFHVQPGVFPTFGIVIQIRNIDTPGQRDAVQLHWGDGANGPKPGLYNKVAFANPPHELTGAIPVANEIWETGDRGTIAVAVTSRNPTTISASAGGRKLDHNVSGDTSFIVHRFLVTFAPSQPADHALEVKVTKAGQPQPTTRASIELMIIGDTAERELCDRLDQLIAEAKHPLFLRHLRSVKAMVQAEWARATVYKKTNVALARETVGYLQSLLKGFRGDSGQWQSYLKEGRPLFMAYISDRDGTLQWYTLTLPEGWDPDKSCDAQAAYPMYFELHGAGNPHYLNNAGGQLGDGGTASGLLGYQRPRTYAQLARKGYHVLPYGRGNSEYRDIGETDIWEAYNDANKTVKIDPDRRYLYGFSMGGGGTWSLGSRTPDRWAAIAVLSMGVRVGDWGQAQNVAQLPIFIWGGEADNVAFGGGVPKDIIGRFTESISKAGGSVTASTTPGLGHSYSAEVQERSYNWLSQYTRRRPNKFSFVCDTPEHRGVWGITMARDLQMSGLPRFDCKIDGQTVRINTIGTPQLEVTVGEDGLGLAGDVTIMLNGTNAFQGPVPAKPIRLKVLGP